MDLFKSFCCNHPGKGKGKGKGKGGKGKGGKGKGKGKGDSVCFMPESDFLSVLII